MSAAAVPDDKDKAKDESQTKHPAYRTRRLIVLVALSIGLMGFLLVSAVALYVYAYGQTDRAAPADVIVVLGGGVNTDGSPTDAQTRRVLHAVTLYQRGLAAKMLCTGGQLPNRPRSEASACVALAEAHGVPATAILREDVSRDTEENIVQAKQVMAANGLHSALIVSDSYHLFRANWLCGLYNLPASFSPAQATQGALPLGEGLIGAYREIGALAWDWLRIQSGG